MANLNSNAAIKFTWSQLLNLYGDYLVYDHTDDYNDDIEVYDHTDDYNDDIEAYDHTDDYNDDIEAYNDTDDYNDDTEFYNDTDDDNDDTEVNDTDDDNYNDDDYNNYILDDDDDYNDYILDGGGNEVPILPEKKNPRVGIPSDCPLQRTQPDEYLFFRQIPEDRIVELFDPDMEDPLESWSSAHELSVAPYRRVEESARAERDIYSDAILLAMRSLSIASASRW
ncbi:hypothetical protein TWF191_009302 [Orbilia oligospora]|uniref:Uncharacterized protein n=1 Tax=Orbilia oligospora TaxID=2813651 RepID=A0A7C8QL76_ORBOL|nr:hypothetical protein TWF191_009302 [Orbilia oligospora]